jgi:hypothetical protein
MAQELSNPEPSRPEDAGNGHSFPLPLCPFISRAAFWNQKGAGPARWLYGTFDVFQHVTFDIQLVVRHHHGATFEIINANEVFSFWIRDCLPGLMCNRTDQPGGSD